MNQQAGNKPVLGLALAVPRDKAEAVIGEQIQKGKAIAGAQITTQQEMEHSKRQHWEWIIETCEILKECFGAENIALHFSSGVHTAYSLKMDPLQQEIEEFPLVANARIDRLHSYLNAMQVIPEPPVWDFQKDLLDNEVYKRSWHHFGLEDYTTALNMAFTEIENTVKDANLPVDPTMAGAPLMQILFDPEAGLLTDMEQREEERQGLQWLFMGAMMYYKQPPGRTVLTYTTGEAAKALVLASLMKATIDQRITALATAQAAAAYESANGGNGHEPESSEFETGETF